jgi:hypothetical protein
MPIRVKGVFVRGDGPPDLVLNDVLVLCTNRVGTAHMAAISMAWEAMSLPLTRSMILGTAE